MVGAGTLLLARTNPMHLVLLQDHPLSANGALVPASLLTILALTLLSPAAQVTGPAAKPRAGRRLALLVWAAAVVLFCGGVLVLESPAALVRRGHDLAGDVYTADGRYELRVFHFDVGAGQDEWDVLVERRGAIRFLAVDAGCLAAEVTSYQGIESFEAGHARLATSAGPVDIEFDTQTMRVTTPVPARLCPDE
jgi:hypothetical protein